MRTEWTSSPTPPRLTWCSRPPCRLVLTHTAPPYVVLAPTEQTVPLVVVSAHSGRDYPADFLAGSLLDLTALRRSEDTDTDWLFAAAPALGAPLLCANFPRAMCDANRAKWELDPAMFDEALPAYVTRDGPRVAAGIGTIARVIASGEAIHRGKMSFATAASRIERCWQPFHDALAELVAATVLKFGHCVLIDAHSMPSQSQRAGRAADVVLGDAHGMSCGAGLTKCVEAALTGGGFRVRRNDPYAGGYITRHYGKPRARVHALQIEVARAIYLDEQLVVRLPGAARIARGMTELLQAAAGWRE